MRKKELKLRPEPGMVAHVCMCLEAEVGQSTERDFCPGSVERSLGPPLKRSHPQTLHFIVRPGRSLAVGP